MDRHPKWMRKPVAAVVVALGVALIGCTPASESSDATADRPSDAASSDQPASSPSDAASSDQPASSPSDAASSDQPASSPSDRSASNPPPSMPPTTPGGAATRPGATQAAAVPAKSRIGGNGIYRVGADIEPGTYHSPGPSNSACYWARLDAQDEILDNGLSRGPSVIHVQPTDAAIETDNCQPFTKG